MPAGRGEEAAERFAAAVELGRTPGLHDVDELARELEIVAMLRSRGAEFAPHPDAKARAKQRLMAAFAEQHAGRLVVGIPSVAPAIGDISRASHGEHTTMLDRVGEPVDATAETTAIPCVEDEPEDALEESAEEPDEQAELASVTELVPGTGRRAAARRGRARRGTSPAAAARRRAAIVGAAALAMMVALAGTGVFLSRDALPGDALYGVKRVAEQVGLALTFDEEARAQRQLELAALRLDEVSQLVARNEQAAADANLLAQTISEFGSSTSEGSRTLLADEQVVAGGGIGDLQAWAAAQAARLAALRSELPQPVVAQADSSIALLDRVLGRTEALQARADCSEIISGIVDEVGALPAEGLCAPRPVTPQDEETAEGGPGTAGTTSGIRRGGNGPGATTAPQVDGTRVPAETPAAPGSDDERVSSSTSEDGERTDESSRTAEPTPTQSDDEQATVPLPVPLMPPITLPSLVPGGKGITLGG